MGQKGKRKQPGIMAVCFALFFGSMAVSAWAAGGNSASSKTATEKEKQAAMEKTIQELDNGKSADPAPQSKGFPDGESGSSAKKKKDEKARLREKEFLARSTEVFWSVSDENLTLEIIPPEKEEILPGKVLFLQEGLLARWKATAPLLLKKKKRNALESPWASEIYFRENVAKTKALDAPVPFYALAEIEIRFAEPVAYDIMRVKQGLRIEFRPLKKRKVITPEELLPEQKEIPFTEIAPTSPGQMLGTAYQTKSKFASYIMGESKATAALKGFPEGHAPQAGLFNGTFGFPKDMKEVYEAAYPAFGSLDYWKKYVRAALDQTVGYSSDYDSSFGAWGGFRANNPAMTWRPDMAIRYSKPGVLSPSVGYQYERTFPVSRLMHFADGYRSQTISFGVGYYPKKPYAIFSENALSFFRGKSLSQNGPIIARQANRGYRMTNALGLNYRLTRKLLWKICGGLERTRSDSPDNGRSRTNMGFLGTDFGYTLTPKLSLGVGYSYRHTFKNTAAPSGPPAPGQNSVKGNDLQAPSAGFSYQPFKHLSLSGSLTPGIVDGKYWKFGGETSMTYKFLKADDISISYSNAVAQDDTAQLTGRNVSGGIGRAGNVQLLRDETTSIEYNHYFPSRSHSDTRLSLSFSYKRDLPLEGFSNDLGNLQDGITFRASIRRRLRGESLWLEFAYQFQNFRSRALDDRGTADTSLKEHALFLSITNYFGKTGR